MRNHDPVQTKLHVWRGLRKLARAPLGEQMQAARELFAPDADYICAHPINQMHGIDEIVGRLLAPMKTAMPDLERRDDIFLCGHYAGCDWVSATGHYFGTMQRSWLGLPASRNWLYVRFGEFYKLDRGRVIDSYVLLDLVDVFRQLGVNPLPRGRGIETLCPGPATHDGLLLSPQDAAEGSRSLALVESMIFDGLQKYDQVSHDSIGMERFWDPDMMWYGPTGVGTTRGLAGFLDLHQYPWQEAFPDYKGGNHKSRIADGCYVASTGWPSIHGTHVGSNLFGLAGTGRPITMRVMDWWRREGDWLVENWIFVDFLDLLLQLDVDLLARARALAAGGTASG